ncbi:unnamed protein product [Sordaria macrospora k-hell]|uniref:WGS project CABT00000000 data, contig 2.65 n=2 Tax=Sordaria macrospora TaxID=5147 RepID=F7WAT4_SORMK|nr:uncharacterized protein SMAC_08762 [Sordaria macrospora k-hell]CCC14249.1 unnamed protein product [Sordaria macrospora k-hell]
MSGTSGNSYLAQQFQVINIYSNSNSNSISQINNTKANNSKTPAGLPSAKNRVETPIHPPPTPPQRSAQQQQQPQQQPQQQAQQHHQPQQQQLPNLFAPHTQSQLQQLALQTSAPLYHQILPTQKPRTPEEILRDQQLSGNAYWGAQANYPNQHQWLQNAKSPEADGQQQYQPPQVQQQQQQQQQQHQQQAQQQLNSGLGAAQFNPPQKNLTPEQQAWLEKKAQEREQQRAEQKAKSKAQRSKGLTSQQFHQLQQEQQQNKFYAHNPLTAFQVHQQQQQQQHQEQGAANGTPDETMLDEEEEEEQEEEDEDQEDQTMNDVSSNNDTPQPNGGSDGTANTADGQNQIPDANGNLPGSAGYIAPLVQPITPLRLPSVRPNLMLGPYDTREQAMSSVMEYAISQGYMLVQSGCAKAKNPGGKYAKGSEVVRVDLMCDRGGTCKNSGTGIRKRPTHKIGCPAKMKLVCKKRHASKWFIEVRCEEHNHDLCPDNMDSIASYRRYRRLQSGGRALETQSERYARMKKPKVIPPVPPPKFHQVGSGGMVGNPVFPLGPPSGPLHMAAMKGQNKILEILINKGGDINAHDTTGRTPLHCAIEGERMDTVTLLVNKGADVTKLDSKGTSPLHAAVSKGMEDAVVLFIEKGADPNR